MKDTLIERVIKILERVRGNVDAGDWWDGVDSEIPEECDYLIARLTEEKKKNDEHNDDYRERYPREN